MAISQTSELGQKRCKETNSGVGQLYSYHQILFTRKCVRAVIDSPKKLDVRLGINQLVWTVRCSLAYDR